MKSKYIKNRIVLGTLISLFIIYNAYLYTSNQSNISSLEMPKIALEGEKIWQDNNCTACHQIYGLGGYLGPDLTNIISNPNKGKQYAKAFFNSGIKSMPKFDFDEQESTALIAFLEHIDKTGYYPNLTAKFDFYGWVTIDYKK